MSHDNNDNIIQNNETSNEIDNQNIKIKKQNDNSNLNKKNKKLLIIIILLVIVIITTIAIVLMNNKTYTINYDSDGGDVIKEQKVKKNEIIIEPTNPTKEGYVFEYWTLNGKKYNFNSKVSSNISLKAKWKKLEEGKILITFDSDGGSKVDNQIINKDEKVKKPDNPKKDGYEFKYWAQDGKEYNFDTNVSNSLTLKAKWEKAEDNKESSNNATKPTNSTNQNSPQDDSYMTCDVKISFITTSINTPIAVSTAKAKCPKESLLDECTVTDIKWPTEIPTRDGYEFVEWRKDFDKIALCHSKETSISPIWRYISKTPNIVVEKVNEIIYATKTYEIYKFYNSNISGDYLRSTELFVSGESGLGSGYEQSYIFNYNKFNDIHSLNNIDNYNIVVNNRNYYQVNNVLTKMSYDDNYYIAILKNGLNHDLSFIARERGFCEPDPTYHEICDRGVRDPGKGDPKLMYSNWSNINTIYMR